jgi:hypothetical protein
VTKTTYGYEEDMAIKYTRAVYNEMRTRMRKAMLFAQSLQQSPLSTLSTTTTRLAMMMKKDFPGQSMNSRL